MGWVMDQPLEFRGMNNDMARESLPGGMAWNLVDYLPMWNDVPLSKRGGWKYYSNTLGVNSYIWSTIFAPYTTGAHQVSFDNLGVMFFDATNKGTIYKPNQTAFSKDLLFITDSLGTGIPRTVNSSGTVANVAAAPKALYSATWGERVIAGGTSASARTIYFSAPDNPTTWDTVNAWFNMSRPISGLAVANGVILAFSTQGVERLVGTNPPPGGNLARRWLADHGCLDWRSIDNWGQFAIWADIDGVYMSDGASVTDITAQAGMKQYWIDLLAGYTTSYTIAGGVYQDHYIVSVMNGATFVDCLCFNIVSRGAFRFSNMPACGFSRSLVGADEFYMALRSTNRIGAGSSIWSPTAAVKNDANGTAVTPLVELPFTTMFFRIPGMRRIFYTSLGMQERIRNVYLGYDIRDAATDNPTLSVGYVNDPSSTAYSAVTPAYGETTGFTRKRLPVRKLGRGFGFRIQQTNASATTSLYQFGFEGHTQEGSK